MFVVFCFKLLYIYIYVYIYISWLYICIICFSLIDLFKVNISVFLVDLFSCFPGRTVGSWHLPSESCPKQLLRRWHRRTPHRDEWRVLWRQTRGEHLYPSAPSARTASWDAETPIASDCQVCAWFQLAPQGNLFETPASFTSGVIENLIGGICAPQPSLAIWPDKRQHIVGDLSESKQLPQEIETRWYTAHRMALANG